MNLPIAFKKGAEAPLNFALKKVLLGCQQAMVKNVCRNCLSQR